MNAGGLWIWSAVKLASFAFLASAASSLSIQNFILPSRTASVPDIDVRDASSSWTIFSDVPEPPSEVCHIQKVWDRPVLRVWDRPVLSNQLAKISSQLCSEVYKARILSASSPHTSDWLMAPPITSIGLRLRYKMIRIAVGLRLGLRTCEPHTCPCEKEVNARGLHGLLCRRSSARQQHHAELNDIIWRSIKRAQIPVFKEAAGLSRTDGKRPDGATLIPMVTRPAM